MSFVASNYEGSKEDDLLWNLVKNNEFLKYDHSIEQMKPSRFDFPADTKQSDDGTTFSNVGIGVIKEYLHIGVVNKNSSGGQVKRSRILLLVWPQFVSPESYRNRKLYDADLRRIKTLVFQVPADVFQTYSKGKTRLHDIVAATAILTPVEEWKLLERAVISSFYHLTFDKATSDLYGNIQVWQNYPKDNLDKEWKQLLFICCGPQGLAYLVKRMLKRNWARIVRNYISIDVEMHGYSVFCTNGVVKLLVEWAKLFNKQEGVVKFLEEIISIKPVLSTSETADRANINFERCRSSLKKHRCQLCPYETNHKHVYECHMRTHTGEAPYVCDICGSAHKKSINLKYHITKCHTGDYPYRCKYCGKPFINRAKMRYHISVHERKGTVQFQCYKCSHISKDETSLLQHIPRHAADPLFICTVCHKTFDSESALVSHVRNHSEDKPFNCHICGRGFLYEHVLREHYITHSDSRTVFTCHVCNKNLATLQTLRTHIVSQHGEER